MVRSSRRIFSTLFLVAVFSLGFSLVATDSPGCSSPFACLADISLFNPELRTSQSTPETVAPIGLVLDFATINEVLRVVGVYALLISIAALIVLEGVEVHYLKLLLGRRVRSRA